MEKQENLSKERIEEKKEDTARHKTDYRLLSTIVMSIFVVFVIGWSICHTVRDINQQATANQAAGEKKTKAQEKQNVGKDLDVDALVRDLLGKVIFDTELKKLDDTVAEGMITAESGTKLQVYMGNGSFADEIVIMTAKNEADAKKNQENAKTHLEEMKTMFQDYIPKEAKKIEDAISIQSGNYVIVCITSDVNTADKIIKSAINQ